MSKSIFPSQREDGSFQIAARLQPSRPLDSSDVMAVLMQGIHRREADGLVAFQDEFTRPPVAECSDGKFVDVVFDGRAGSRMWKDWVVALTRELENSDLGVRFLEMLDLVSGRAHPSWPGSN